MEHSKGYTQPVRSSIMGVTRNSAEPDLPLYDDRRRSRDIDSSRSVSLSGRSVSVSDRNIYTARSSSINRGASSNENVDSNDKRKFTVTRERIWGVTKNILRGLGHFFKDLMTREQQHRLLRDLLQILTNIAIWWHLMRSRKSKT